MSEDIFEKAFGKAPETGYEFKSAEVELIDKESFKGFDIAWSASGVGFGHLTVGFGVGEERKKNWPLQYGFYSDSECMSKEFVEALIKYAAPVLAQVIFDNDINNKPQPPSEKADGR